MTHFFARFILIVALCVLQACTLPSAIQLPDDKALKASEIPLEDLAKLHEPVYLVSPGDVIRIVREDEDTFADAAVSFEVRPDGYISYPYVGVIKASGKTIDNLQSEITEKLTPVYQHPTVSINIYKTSNNKIFVGGAVRSPSAFDVSAVQTIEQAIIAAGGLLNSADAKHVALLRADESGKYRVYFSDLGKLLHPEADARGVKLARGDVLFIPKSAIGNAVDSVDMYMNQLIPFTKSLGLGFSYILHQPDNTTRIQQ